jgi:hypothetical protein
MKKTHVIVDTTDFANYSIRDGSSLDRECALELPLVDKRCMRQQRKVGIIARPTMKILHISYNEKDG